MKSDFVGEKMAAETPHGNWKSYVVLGLVGILVVLILVASWVPDSRMSELPGLPRWLASLADSDPNIRTALPFIPLMVLTAYGFASLFPDKSGFRGPLTRALLVCEGILLVTELGQVLIPRRTADVMDLLWGSAGIGIGAMLAWTMVKALVVWRRS